MEATAKQQKSTFRRRMPLVFCATLILATLAYFPAGVAGALMALVFTPAAWFFGERERGGRVKVNAQAKQERALKREFFCTFSTHLPDDKTRWPEFQPVVDKQLTELWANAQAIFSRRPETFRLQGDAWQKVQGRPERKAFGAYWKAYHIAEDLGFKVPSRGNLPAV